MTPFKLVSPMRPMGDQPRAIEELTRRILAGEPYSTLLGVTGSGKTFTMAHVIQNLARPALVISHNKTLAAQLYAEFRDFFPHNAVHYFVSYYDYYQPEAYIPQRDIYIEKDAGINEDLDRLRLAATSALMSRRDVIIVASVSAIYGLGSPEDYLRMIVSVRKGETLDRRSFFARLVDIQYERNDIAFTRGHYRVRGDVFEILPSYEETGIRIEFSGDRVERISEIHPTSGEALRELEGYTIYPSKHFVMPDEKVQRALQGIRDELAVRLKELQAQGRILEAQRLSARTRYDLEMLEEVGYCKGIENYSRHLSGRAPGQRPYTLIDYFPKDFLTVVDESHVTLPQVRGMYVGDRSRKETLVEYGFRLPSALDNRPMRFDEWEANVPQVVFVSATPGPYEIKMSKGEVVEQIIRPTGLIDPLIHVKPARNQVQDLLVEIRKRVEKKERVLVTTLTKKLAEDLSQYLQEEGLKGCYLHSEVQTFERVKILNDLRTGRFNVLVGVNLLREGLDLPEVTLVAILDADKEGFLRSETSIIQTIGRTARNVNGEVILYADKITESMDRAIRETQRRRTMQMEYNKQYGITPTSIEKAIRKGIEEIVQAKEHMRRIVHQDPESFDRAEVMAEMEREMLAAAERLDFEKAAELRDQIRSLSGEGSAAPAKKRSKFRAR